MGPYDIIPANVRIFGRTLDLAGALWLGYSGSGIEFFTDASEVKIQVLGVSDTNLASEFAFLGVFLEDREVMDHRIMVKRGLTTYPVVSNPGRARMKIRIVKLTEAKCDKVALSCIEADGYVEPTSAPRRRILFLGDSLTAGYGILGRHTVKDPPEEYIFTTSEEDCTQGFACRCARGLHAEAELVCWSGSGIISRHIRGDQDLPLTDNLLPTLYHWVDRATEQCARAYLKAHGWQEDEKTVTAIRPERSPVDVVVVNLGTNDASFTKGMPVREQHFRSRYLEFMRQVRQDYPAARILITYGVMEKSLASSCREVAMLGDYEYMEMPIMMPSMDGIGGGGHPSARTHEKLADMLSWKVLAMTGWSLEPEPEDEGFLDGDE